MESVLVSATPFELLFFIGMLGFGYLGVQGNGRSKGTNISTITNKNSVLDSLIATSSRLGMKQKTHSLHFNAITKIDTMGRELSIDVDYFNFKSGLDNKFNTNTYFPDGTFVPNRFISANSLSNQKIDIYTTKADYKMPLRWINLLIGGKLSFINNHSDVSYFELSDLIPTFDPSKSNQFRYRENTQAIYLSGSREFSEKWSAQAGLRIENTRTIGYSETLNQTNINDYIKPFPTFYLTYKPNENSVLGLNYNRRIDRPSYGDLNPFRFYSSAYNYSEGNPFLQPFYTDNIEISHTYNDFYTSLYFTSLANGFEQVTFVSPNNISQIVTPYNFYNQKNIGTDGKLCV